MADVVVDCVPANLGEIDRLTGGPAGPGWDLAVAALAELPSVMPSAQVVATASAMVETAVIIVFLRMWELLLMKRGLWMA